MGASDPFGNPISPRPRNPIFPAFPIAVISVVCVAGIALLATSDAWTRLGHLLTDPSRAGEEARCQQLSEDRTGGPEGTCTRWSPRFGAQTTFVVVNERHRLRVPEYTVTSGTVQITGPGVRHPAEYTEGVEQLLSVHLTVTNTTGSELPFGSDGAAPLHPHYAPGPDIVELVLPDGASPTGETGYAVLLGARRAPRPDILGSIPPHDTRSGWVTFGVPAAALTSMSQPGARLDFLPPAGRSGYTGQIRI